MRVAGHLDAASEPPTNEVSATQWWNRRWLGGRHSAMSLPARNGRELSVPRLDSPNERSRSRVALIIVQGHHLLSNIRFFCHGTSILLYFMATAEICAFFRLRTSNKCYDQG